MPDQLITFTDAELDMLDKVRQQQGLHNVQQAAEWLAKMRLRRQARQSTGRARAIYIVEEGKPS